MAASRLLGIRHTVHKKEPSLIEDRQCNRNLGVNLGDNCSLRLRWILSVFVPEIGVVNDPSDCWCHFSLSLVKRETIPNESYTDCIERYHLRALVWGLFPIHKGGGQSQKHETEDCADLSRSVHKLAGGARGRIRCHPSDFPSLHYTRCSGFCQASKRA